MIHFWYVPLVVMVPLFFLWTLVHEGCHALTAKFYGMKIKEFKPYPHRSGGRLYMGSVSFSYRGNDPTDEQVRNIALSPYVPDIVAAIGLGIGIFLSQGWVLVLLLTLMLAPILNTGNQARLLLLKRDCDFSKMPKQRLWPFIATAIYALIFIVGLLVGILL